jgi:hypothetical protein
MEGFDRLVDKHYDRFHDGVGKGYNGARQHIHLPTRGRKKKSVQPDPFQQRASSEPRDDLYRGSQVDPRPQDFSDDENQGYTSDRPRRKQRRDTVSREDEDAFSPNRKVRISPYREVWVPSVKPALPSLDLPYAKLTCDRQPYPAELPKDNDHIYPPPPQGIVLGQRPETGPAVAPDYRQPKDLSSAPRYARPNPSPDAPPRRKPYPSERRRRHSYDYSRSPERRPRHESKPKEHSISASIAGALAGGFLGHQAGKGDMFTTAAGALVGAFGGGAAAEKHARSKEKSRRRDRERERSRYDSS